MAVILVGSGCSDTDSDASSNPAPAAVAAKVNVSTPAPVSQPVTPPPAGAAAASAETATPETAPSRGISPELNPIQSAIQLFEAKNGRMPNNVAELVDAGLIQQLPKLPPGRIYYIDHATKQVKIGSDP